MSVETLLPQNAELVGEFNPGSELGITFTEPAGVELLDSSAQVFKSLVDDGDRFDVVLNHDPFDAQKLLDFLKIVAPLGQRDSIVGVVGDWNVVDRAASKVVNDREARRIVKDHRQLGVSWNEFMLSRQAFLTTMQDAVVPNFKTSSKHDNRATLVHSDGISNNTLEEATRRAGLRRVRDILEQNGLGYVAEMVQEAVEAEVNKKRFGHKPITKIDTLNRRFMSWGPQRRNDLFRMVLSRLPIEERSLLTDGIGSEFYDKTTFPDGKTYAYSRALLDKPLAELLLDTEQETRRAYVAEFIRLRRSPNTTTIDKVLVPGSIRRTQDPARIRPHISWVRRNDGTHELIFERAEAKDGLVYTDGVLGALAIAYFSPDIREKWPTTLPIRDKNQAMGVAQVPVLALMRKSALAKSDFVNAAESVAA